jgi:RNA 2',3'-cyclic 3'-phosphodiesterase
MIRAFIAVDIPEDVRASVVEAQARFKRAHVAVKISWTKAENWHLTLQFLGYVDESVIPSISNALDGLVKQSSPFNLNISGAGAFPNENRPRVLWVGCADAEGKLKVLAVSVQKAMKEFGFEPEHREFSAHLTLARMRFSKPDDALTRALDSIKNECFGTMRVDAVHLYESQLHPQGSTYRKLSSHALRAA